MRPFSFLPAVAVVAFSTFAPVIAAPTPQSNSISQGVRDPDVAATHATVIPGNSVPLPNTPGLGRREVRNADYEVAALPPALPPSPTTAAPKPDPTSPAVRKRLDVGDLSAISGALPSSKHKRGGLLPGLDTDGASTSTPHNQAAEDDTTHERRDILPGLPTSEAAPPTPHNQIAEDATDDAYDDSESGEDTGAETLGSAKTNPGVGDARSQLGSAYYGSGLPPLNTEVPADSQPEKVEDTTQTQTHDFKHAFHHDKGRFQHGSSGATAANTDPAQDQSAQTPSSTPPQDDPSQPHTPPSRRIDVAGHDVEANTSPLFPAPPSTDPAAPVTNPKAGFVDIDSNKGPTPEQVDTNGGERFQRFHHGGKVPGGAAEDAPSAPDAPVDFPSPDGAPGFEKKHDLP
ncbi:hypothetical protein ABKN59_007215 [Abortiporus biennis]